MMIICHCRNTTTLSHFGMEYKHQIAFLCGIYAWWKFIVCLVYVHRDSFTKYFSNLLRGSDCHYENTLRNLLFRVWHMHFTTIYIQQTSLEGAFCPSSLFLAPLPLFCPLWISNSLPLFLAPSLPVNVYDAHVDLYLHRACLLCLFFELFAHSLHHCN